VLDTYFDLSDPGKIPSEPLEMLLLCFLGVDGWERVMFISFRKERIQLAGVERAVGVEPSLGDLQLRSARIDVGHFERARFTLVDGSEGAREGAGDYLW
jgi:hypothetical protein